MVAQPTKLEAVDGNADPLGPLGAELPSEPALDVGPTPPRKETKTTKQPPTTSQQGMGASMMSSIDLDDDSADTGRGRIPPPVQSPPAAGDSPKRQGQPSMSIEQAAKPTFDIAVGDPHKVGDLTSSHIVYQVRTKVDQTSSRSKRCY